MSGNLDKKARQVRLSKKIGLTATGLFLLYVIIGFWVVPPLLKNKIESQLTDVLGRKVIIGAFKLNPLVLSATTSDLTVHDVDGAPFAGFEELYVNVQLSSLFRWAGTVREIRLLSPFGIVRVMPEGKMNIDDLIAIFFSPSTPPPEGNRGLPRAIVSRLEVIDGKFTVENSATSEPVRDVVAPITFTLENLSTLKGREGEFHFTGKGPIGGNLALNGSLELNPPKIQGNFTTTGVQLNHHWEHIKDLVSFQIVKGMIDLSADFSAAIDGNGLSARLENGSIQLENLELVEKGEKTVLIDLPVLATEGINADVNTHEITIESVETAGARIQTWLSGDGTLTHQQLLLNDLDKLMDKMAANAPASETPPPQPWHVTLDKMEATNWRLAIEDRTLTHPAKLSVDDIHAVVQNLTNKKDIPARVEVAMQINGSGQVHVDGTAGINPIRADMKVAATKIALKPFQPYVDEAVNAQVTSGATSSTGRIRYLGHDAKPQIRYEGELSVDDIEIQDQVQPDDFITLNQFKASGIALELLPNKLSVSDGFIDRPHARVAIDEAGVINVVNAFVSAVKEDESGTENLLQRLIRFLIMEFKGPMPLHVKRIRLERFTGDFMDASILPPFSTRMEITNGTLTGLSSAPSARADFKVNGNIDQTATIEASGQINPMNALKYSKIEASVKDFALKPVSPYSGKYIGFKIDKGILHTDLNYNVNDDNVKGDNVITIDGLELGEPVDSPDALNLPIRLGVTLLKDKNGRIMVQVPVVGDVKDPRFDLAKTVKSALTGTIEKAGREPFSAITEIDGFTGEQLRVVEFGFGFSTLEETETGKLDALAKYLREKGALTLGIVGTADRRMDGAAVMGGSLPQSPSGGESKDKEKAPPDAATDGVVDDKLLEQLAHSRAETVRAYLIEQAGIDATRIQVQSVTVNPEPAGENGLVEFNLSLK